jgi:integral membrane protein (TIGR01906 family)
VNTLGGRAASVLVGVAAAVVIVSLAILPFLSLQWVAFEQGRSNASGWTGYTTTELNAATGSILSDLVVGPPTFAVEVRGQAVLDPRERGHMRDVRTVFSGGAILAGISVLVLVASLSRGDRRATWRAVRRGAIGLAVVVVALGAVALVAFDALFETFHQVLFPAGSYDFDPATERLVQLFPFQFWQETAIVVGLVILALCAITGILAASRTRDVLGAEPVPGELAAVSRAHTRP